MAPCADVCLLKLLLPELRLQRETPTHAASVITKIPLSLDTQRPTADSNFHSNQMHQSSVKREAERRKSATLKQDGESAYSWIEELKAKAAQGACIMAFPYCATQMDIDNTQTRTRSELQRLYKQLFISIPLKSICLRSAAKGSKYNCSSLMH